MRTNMMKQILFILTVAVGLTSCEKARELTQFRIETNTTVTIPSASGVNLPVTILTPDVETNSTSTFENNNTRADLIEEIRLESSNLQITSPSSANFDFLKSIEIYIQADNLPETLIAEKQDIQNGQGQSLQLDVTGVDLTEYMTKSSIDLRVTVVTDEIPSSDIDIDVTNVFFVDARILGL